MELTKNDTKMIQGLSVIAMVWLHLFDVGYQNLFSPLIFIQGTPLSFYIAQLSDFCTFGFAFCSGYAHMLQFDNKDYYKKRLKGLFSILCSFWLILILFTIISILVGKSEIMPGNLLKWIANALTIENSYNGAWWYMFTYIILVMISPVVLRVSKKFPTILVLFISFVVYVGSYYIRFKVDSNNWFLLKIGPFGMTLAEYIVGAVCYRRKWFSTLSYFWKRMPKFLRSVVSAITVIFLLYIRTKIIPSFFFAPFSGFVIVFLFQFLEKPKTIRNIFIILGKHSTNIWLTHMFFYSVIFVNFVYIAKYPVAIFGLMLAITVLLSVVLKFLIAMSKKLLLLFNNQ